MLGTLAYMAPEQSEGSEVGAEADLYSLALVLVRGAVRLNPVRGATRPATARRIGNAASSRSGLARCPPRGVGPALHRALARAPGRPGSLAELRAALAAGRQLALVGAPSGGRASRRNAREAGRRLGTGRGYA